MSSEIYERKRHTVVQNVAMSEDVSMTAETTKATTRKSCLYVTKRRNGGNRCGGANKTGKPQKVHSEELVITVYACQHCSQVYMALFGPILCGQHRSAPAQVAHCHNHCHARNGGGPWFPWRQKESPAATADVATGGWSRQLSYE